MPWKLVLARAAVLISFALFRQALGSSGKPVVLLAAMPPLISSISLAREYEFEVELTDEIAAFGASLALVTVPLWGAALELLAHSTPRGR